MTRFILLVPVLLAGCTPSLTGSGPRATERTGSACIDRNVRTFGALEARIAELEAVTRPDLHQSCELALLYVTGGRFADAERVLARILAAEPRDLGANLLRARIFDRTRGREARRDGEDDDDRPADDTLRLRAAEQALAADSLLPDAHLALARLLHARGEHERAFRHVQAAIRLDPWNESAHSSLATGGSYLSWSRFPPLHDDSVPVDLALRLTMADTLLLRGQYDTAEAAFRAMLAEHPGLAAARMGLGAAHYYREEFEDAARILRDVAHEYPGFGLAHYGVTQSMRRLRERSDTALQAAIDRFHRRPRPPEPERLREVFVDFDRLGDDFQKIVLVSVAPLSNYIPILAIAGATVQLLPFHKRLWELPHKERNRGRRTFDLRLWDDVKGQGGFHAVAGEEWMRDVMYERFNVLSHEFMHQVHSFFTEQQRNEVETLFRLAKREERTLDSYADYNEQEYLAQAYEAYISAGKQPGLGATARHTRAEVREKDPRIFAFLDRVNARPSYRENEIIAHRQKVRNLVSEGKLAEAEAAAEAALAQYSDHPDLITALTGVLRVSGDYARALELDTRATTLFPDRVRGWLDLADDHALQRHDHTAAAEVLAHFVAIDAASEEAWLALAEHQAAAGDTAAAAHSLERAAAILGQPIAEEGYFATTATVALLRGDRAAARAAYRYSIENISRSDIPGWTEQAAMALAEGDLEQAKAFVTTARSIDAEAPAVRELEARVLVAEGGAQEGVAALRSLLERDPRRLQTLTALVEVLGRENTPQAGPYVAAGRRVIELREPVSFAYERNRWVPKGRLEALAIARFEAAVARSAR